MCILVFFWSLSLGCVDLTTVYSPCLAYHSCLLPSSPQVIVFLLLAYPFSYVMLELPSTNLKHLFSGVLGVWMMQTAHYTNWIHSFLVIVATYVMCRTLPNKSVSAPLDAVQEAVYYRLYFLLQIIYFVTFCILSHLAAP